MWSPSLCTFLSPTQALLQTFNVRLGWWKVLVVWPPSSRLEASKLGNPTLGSQKWHSERPLDNARRKRWPRGLWYLPVGRLSTTPRPPPDSTAQRWPWPVLGESGACATEQTHPCTLSKARNT